VKRWFTGGLTKKSCARKCSWFLVLGSWFLVLGSWFLVLGSWFLVLGDIYAHFDKYTMLSGDRQSVFLVKNRSSQPEKKALKSPFFCLCVRQEKAAYG